jgi:hypothetical protein
MRTRGFVLALALGMVGMVAAAEPARLPSQKFLLEPLDAAATYTVARPDVAKLLAEDAAAPKGRPLRYAQGYDVALVAYRDGKSGVGRWETLPDGRYAWRLAIEAPGALSIDLGFRQMFLPQGADLYFASADGKQVQRYSDQDNTPNGRFYLPVIMGERALLELVVPAERQRFVALELEKIHYGYRDVWTGTSPFAKSGTCNVDSICPQGDPIRNQIRAHARYSVGGGLCSGQLLNNTARNNRRLFSSAHHCFDAQSEADTVVVYWRYENPTCRTVGSAQNGQVLPLSGNSIVQTGGATLLATETDSDFTLVELRTAIPSGVDPFWNGWDRTETGFASASVVHHPQGHEKRISFENNPLVLSNSPPQGVPGTLHWRVNDWDLGTTEQGSSGSGLLSSQNRVIGFLSGGSALCGNDFEDYFGRLSSAWNGDGSPSNRLRDHLDPSGSNVNTLDGLGGCAAPSVQVSGPASGSSGTPITFSATITGGVPPYRVDWDVDNDGFTDRSTPGVSSSTTVAPNYATAFSTNVVARVTDAVNCSGQGQAALNVGAPDIVPTAQTAQQLCGDNDAAIEPGESWRVPVSLFNSGGQALSGGYAVFAEPQGGGATTTFGPDGFGYRGGDDTAGCAYNFVDLDGQVAALTLTPSGSVAAEDDGRTNVLNLGTPFSFYGQSLPSVTMSTNGYISGGSGESGGDYDNVCGLAVPDRGSVLPRFNVFNDDLVVRTTLTNAGLRAATANPCPRQAESASGPTSCVIFQWSRMGLYAGGGTPSGDFDLQAILYPATGQIVYQYRENPPGTGDSATVGTINGNATQGLQYACNQANTVRDARAVCIYNPQFLPQGGSTADQLRNDTPAIALNNLGSGQTQVVNAEFRVNPSAQCGSNLRLDYVATVDANAWSRRAATVVNATLGAGGSCQVASCSAAASSGAKGAAPAITPVQGLFANPKRFGNGIGSFVIATSPTPTYFGLWFTGQQNRNPTWYAIQGPYVDNQAIAPVLRFVNNAAPNGFSVSSTTVGTAQITYVNPTTYIFTSTVDGRFSAEIQSVLYPGTRPNPNRTAAWYPPAESGWGTVFDDHFLSGNPEQVGINYIYGSDGVARWALGASSNLTSGSQSQNTWLVHCPDCPNFNDFGSFPLASGSITRSFSSQTAGTVSTSITIPSPAPSNFVRNNANFQMLTTPQPPLQ